jgi:hypothetical protein
MRIPGTRRSRLVVLLSLAGLAVVIGLLLFARVRALYRNLGPLVVQELQRQLGREVAIGRVDVHVPGRVVMDQVAIAAGKRLSGGALARARQVVLTYSWSGIFSFHPDVVGSIRRIDIKDPSLLLVREPSGRFNVQDLFKPRRGAPPTHFRAQITVTHGRLFYEDYKAALAPLPAVNEVGGIDGALEFSTYPRLTAHLTGAGRRGRAGRIEATTLINVPTGQLLVQAYAADADAAYWARYLARTPAARVESGRANLDLVVTRTAAKAPLEFVVNLAARGLGVKVARLNAPIQAGRGFAQITSHGVKLEASARLAGMPVQVSGNILNFKNPQVALSVSGTGMTLAAVRRVLPQVPAVPGLNFIAPGAAQAWVLGPAARLYATGTLTLSAAAWRGERIQVGQIAWRFHAGMLQLDRITASEPGGGRLSATGWVQLAPGPASVYVTGQASQIDLADLPGLPPRTRLDGTGDVQFAVSGTRQDLHGGATVRLFHPSFNSARLDAVVARLDYQDGVLYVRSLQAADPRGRLNAAGTVARNGDLNLQVRAKGIDLAALMAPFSRQRASGIAYFSGSIDGTVRQPRLAGQLQVYGGRIGPVDTDYAGGEVVLLPDRVETTGLMLRIYPGQVTVRGSAGGWREGHTLLDLHARGADLSVARLLAMASLKTRASGTLSGRLTLVGSLPAPVATGTLQVDDLLVAGTHLGTAAARLETDGRRLQVRQASIQGEALAATAQGSIGLVAAAPESPNRNRNRNRNPNRKAVDSRLRLGLRLGLGAPGGPAPSAAPTPAARLAGTRTITKESPLDLTFAVQKLDLARAASRGGLGVLLAGIARVTDGVVRGRLGAPVVTARAEVAPLAVNGVAFGGLSGQIAYTREQITLHDVALREGSGAIRVTQASLRPETGKPLNALTVDAKVDSFPLQRLAEIALRSATVRNGGPSPTSSPSGFEQVSGSVSGTLTARPETNAPGAPVLWTATLAAPSLTVPGYRLAPDTGAANPANTQPLSVGLEVQASYSMAGRLALDRLAITRGDGILLARGMVVPEGGRDAQGRELPQGQVTLRVDATDIPMGLLEPLAPSLHPLRGTSELHLDAAGSLRAPAIQGSLDVDKLALAGIPFTHFAIPFIRVGAPQGGGLGSIQIENARLAEDDKDHPSGEHYLTMDGTLPFRWQTNDRGMVVGGRVPADAPLSVTVRLPAQSLDLFNTLSKVDPKTVSPRLAPTLAALGSLSAVSGSLSADVHIAGTRTQPDASGNFQINGGAFQPQRGETRFDQIAVRLGFSGNRIQVQQFTGRSSNGGTFQGSGDVSGIALGVGDQAPAAQINLALALNDLHYTERNLSTVLQERFRGTLRTVARGHPDQRAPLHLTGDWRAPTLEGEIDLLNTRLALPASLPEAKPRAAVPVPNPNFLLDVRLARDVWLENPVLRMQMAGDLPIRGTLAEPSVHATLTVQRGQMTYPTARFRVEGTVEIAYSPTASTPDATSTPTTLRVDLTATSRIRGTDPNTGQRQSYDVTLNIRGPLTAQAYQPGASLISETRPGQQLTIEATSNPPLSQEQILALLGQESAIQAITRGGVSAENALRQTVTDTLTGSVLPTLFTPLTSSIERWLGLEEFSVEFAFDEPLQLLMTKKIYGPFFVTYTQALNTSGFNSTSPSSTVSPATSLNLSTLEIFYKLSNRYRLGYRIEQPSNKHVVTLDTTFRF